MSKTILTWSAMAEVVCAKGDHLLRLLRKGQEEETKPISIFPIPRGGVPPALMLTTMFQKLFAIVDTPEQAEVFVDDIIDSGATMKKWLGNYPEKLFLGMVDKQGEDKEIGWVVFPWEIGTSEESGPEENVVRLLEYIGEDPKREGLVDTPARVIRSFEELYGGYKVEPASVLKTFEDGSCDEMVVLKNVEFFSTCEHHMLPFVGTAHIGYVPNGRVVGISKLARLLEVFSRRLQIQERLTQQITEALDKELQPFGSACVLEAKHLCMACRGVNKQRSIMVTSSLTGVFRKQEVRQEFLNFIRG